LAKKIPRKYFRFYITKYKLILFPLGDWENNFSFDDINAIYYCLKKCPESRPLVKLHTDYFQYTCTETCEENQEAVNGWCKCKNNKIYDFESLACIDGEKCKDDDVTGGTIYYFDQTSRTCYPNGCLKMQDSNTHNFNFKFSTGTLLNPGPGKKGVCTKNCNGFQQKAFNEYCLCNEGFVLFSDDSICISEGICWEMGKYI
jgi:hypothetical protein